MILLDYNEDRSFQTASNLNKGAKSSNETLDFDNIQTSLAKIQVNTLSSNVSFGLGRFLMSDVKRMTAKDEFLEMPLTDRNCEVELYEDCRTRKLLEGCRCVPWEIPGYQVREFESYCFVNYHF